MKNNKGIIIALLVMFVVLIGFAIFVVSTDPDVKASITNQELSKNKEKDVIKLSEKMFMTTINNMYTNFEDYSGKTIIVEGFPLSNNDLTFVSRYGPGCCSGDVYAFLEYEYPEKLDLVDETDWIRVEGILKKGMDNGKEYIYIEASSVEKLSKRGIDKVTS